MNDSAPLALLDESQIKDLIYEVRGQKVMLDFDLARIYGYGTSAFNQQIKRNLDRFPQDFSFQLTKQEFESILLSHFVTSSWGGRRSLPRAFTEQGIYMLMTVLHGDLAIEQSITLIRLFRSMKDYIVETQSLGSANEVLALANQVRTNTEKISKIEGKLDMLMDNFIDPSTYKSFLIMDGEKVESDVAYQRIYSMAKQRVYLIDDYIDVKTIQLLKSCNSGVRIIVFSDNKARNSLNQAFVAVFLPTVPTSISNLKRPREGSMIAISSWIIPTKLGYFTAEHPQKTAETK